MTTLILAILLTGAGLAVLVVAVLLILGPLRRPLRAVLERASLQRCIAHRDRGDARLAAADVPGALREFGAAFCFLVPRAEPPLLAEVARLNAQLLGRLITVADDLPGTRVQLLALAAAERALGEWMDASRQVLKRAPTGAGADRLGRLADHAKGTIRELVRELTERQQRPPTH
jgi:hypothetical protein